MKVIPACVSKIQRTYNALLYRATKAILTPVMGAMSDAIREAVTLAVKDGMREAYSVNISSIGDFLLGKKK